METNGKHDNVICARKNDSVENLEQLLDDNWFFFFFSDKKELTVSAISVRPSSAIKGHTLLLDNKWEGHYKATMTLFRLHLG